MLKRSKPLRRTPLKSKSAPSRKSRLTRKTRVRPKNAKRAAAKFERNFGERGAAIREMPCLCHGRTPAFGAKWPCFGDTVAAHARARGMGGCKGDRRELVPLCQFHHVLAGELRTHDRMSFEGNYGIDLTAEAARIAAELDAQGYE